MIRNNFRKKEQNPFLYTIRQCRLDLFDNIVEAMKNLHEVLASSEAQLSFIDEEFGLFIFWIYEIKFFKNF